MLSIHPTAPQKCTPNLLPARINHNGPINDTERYWKPTTDEKGTQHAYLRGRHLHGTTLALPANYTGVVLNVTEKQLPQSQSTSQSQPKPDEDAENEDEDMEDTNIEVKIAEQIGEFDSVVVWEHGGVVDGEKDMFIRGVREWIGFAESMHVEEEEEESKTA